MRARSLATLALAAALLASTAAAASSRPPRVVATVRTGGGPIGLAVGAGSLWVANYTGESLERIAMARNRVAARVPLGNSPYGSAFGAGSVWVSSFDSANVTRVDPATNRIVARIDVGLEQAGLAATATDVWVAVYGRGQVVRIDPGTNSVEARIAVGGNPEDVVHDSRRRRSRQRRFLPRPTLGLEPARAAPLRNRSGEECGRRARQSRNRQRRPGVCGGAVGGELQHGPGAEARPQPQARRAARQGRSPTSRDRARRRSALGFEPGLRHRLAHQALVATRRTCRARPGGLPGR